MHHQQETGNGVSIFEDGELMIHSYVNLNNHLNITKYRCNICYAALFFIVGSLLKKGWYINFCSLQARSHLKFENWGTAITGMKFIQCTVFIYFYIIKAFTPQGSFFSKFGKQTKIKMPHSLNYMCISTFMLNLSIIGSHFWEIEIAPTLVNNSVS